MRFLKYLMCIVFTGGMLANAFAGSTEGIKDHWPWQWGSECPFPWQGVQGQWRVIDTDATPGGYSDQVLEFMVVDNSSKGGARLLQVNQYNAFGRLLASGEGVSSHEDRVITAYMTPIQPGQKSYKVMVRSYLRNTFSVEQAALCKSSESVMAVTFCPIRGRKCLADSNYVLERQR